ncbi:MAG: alpha/beta hydrolase [Proteobacteria bacterium]|nr:alpha/beta hydrolase [Pseudomonadota bacterium]
MDKKMPKNSHFIFSETFGETHNPAILLNAGAGNQLIIWPERFCKDLAAKGYFVIRYDYRDTGLSAHVPNEEPYTVLDLAQDAIEILKKYHLEKATFVGFSMGGQLAQFVGAYFPQYAENLILIATSTDFKSGFDALMGNLSEGGGLSTPKPEYLAFLAEAWDFSEFTLEKKIDFYVEVAKVLEGRPKDFEEDFFRNQAQENYERTPLNAPHAHTEAMLASFDLHQKAPELIQIPTLIIHGEKDPIFPLDHAEALKNRIKDSKLLIWDDFGHAISPRHFTRLITAIDSFIKKGREEKLKK